MGHGGERTYEKSLILDDLLRNEAWQRVQRVAAEVGSTNASELIQRLSHDTMVRVGIAMMSPELWKEAEELIPLASHVGALLNSPHLESAAVKLSEVEFQRTVITAVSALIDEVLSPAIHENGLLAMKAAKIRISARMRARLEDLLSLFEGMAPNAGATHVVSSTSLQAASSSLASQKMNAGINRIRTLLERVPE
jgi:hypothetical protein